MKYNAVIYTRISKDDGEKSESNSIKNQKDFIRDYLSKIPDIQICSERCDDGYTGSNFERPDFISMIKDIESGKINCVVVKDLSRFGRDFVATGRYISKIFPMLGVRFIAINDCYDSISEKNFSQYLTVPFKNLIKSSFYLGGVRRYSTFYNHHCCLFL